MTNKTTLLSVWDADEGRPYIVGRKLSDYNITYPESLLIFEARLNVEEGNVSVESFGVHEVDKVVNLDNFTEQAEKYGSLYVAVVDGEVFMSSRIPTLYKLLADAFGEGIVWNCKIKPYDTTTEVEVVITGDK